MSRVAFFVDDLFGDALYASSFADPKSPATNALDKRPGIMFQSAEGADGQFEVYSTNKWIDIDEGGGEVSVSIPLGVYRRLDLTVAITAALNASALALTYSTYFNANNQFRIDGAGGNFDILWKTGTHGSDNAATSIAREIGFSPILDSTGMSTYIATLKRFSTATSLIFDMGTATEVHAVALMLDGNSDTDYGTGTGSYLKVFGNASLLGLWIEGWNAGASLTMAFSGRPSETENTIQMAGQAAVGSVAYRYYMVAWRHYDESDEHRIGLCKAYQTLQSSSRTVRELDGHGLDDPSQPTVRGNYYPVSGDLVWHMPLAFDSWDASDYRAIIHPAIRQRRSTPIVVALRWDDILATTYTVEDEADIGFVLYGSVTRYSKDKFVAEGSESMTGELLIEQLR